MLPHNMDGILNEVTDTIHKYDLGESGGQTICGAMDHVSHDAFRMTSLESAGVSRTADKCGRCFEDGGGY